VSWGEHVHHGLWLAGRDARRGRLAPARRWCRRRARAPGDAVVDVGCGYGATSRLLAAERGAMTG
jgi:tocopherol O-methyltransferase